MGDKPGILTTEFWMTVLVQVVLAVLASLGKLPVDLAAALGAGSGTVYVGARGGKKMIQAAKQ